jgi:4'-phosphopantetheinyl transferase
VSARLDDLTPEALHVWRIRLTQSDDVVRMLEEHLSPDEVLRADRFRKERDRTRFVVAHGALRELLAEYTAQTPRGVFFGCTAAGKPFLVDEQGEQPLRFNLSHSGDWAAVGLALSTEVGIDIEQIDSEVSVEAVAERFFSRSEFEALRAVPPDQRADVFFTAWARKEAYVKARGDGIPDRLREFSLSVDPGQTPVLLTDSTDVGGVRRWTIYDLDIAPGHAAAIAAEGSAHRIRMMRWTQPL